MVGNAPIRSGVVAISIRGTITDCCDTTSDVPMLHSLLFSRALRITGASGPVVAIRPTAPATPFMMAEAGD
jgi:hypothetical protein